MTDGEETAKNVSDIKRKCADEAGFCTKYRGRELMNMFYLIRSLEAWENPSDVAPVEF